MNRFSYYIITHFIISNKDYNSYRNPHLVYQTYPKSSDVGYVIKCGVKIHKVAFCC